MGRFSTLLRLAMLGVAATFAMHALGSRVRGPMGQSVRSADTIVIADTAAGGERGRATVLTIREVIKGDVRLAGKSVTLPVGPHSSADAYVPIGKKGLAVLLAKGWQTAARWPVLEVCSGAEETRSLRVIAAVYRRETERQRLLALWDVFLSGDRVCREQLFADLRDMQDPNNFDLLSGFYTKLDPPHQERIVVLIGDIGDVRGVPTLIEALKSPDASVGRRAAHALAWAFPGAPGVTEAFGEALGRDHLAPEAARYLIKRRLTPELRGLAAVVETPLAQARRLTDAGETGAARAAYRSVLEDRDAPTTHRLQAARALLQDATPKERGDIRKAVLRMVPQERRSGDHGLAEQAAVTLRALRHPDCLQALLVLLQGQSTLDRAAMRITTMAVRELGAAARRKAAIQLIDTLAERAPGFGVARPSQSMLSLIWLADRDGYEQASMVMDEGHRRAWATLEPLRSLADCADEGTLLAELLSGKRPRKPQPEAPATATVSRTQLTNASVTVSWAGPGLPPEALEWIVFRLGDLRDRRAIQLLSHHMVKFASWQSGAAAAEALRTIGGPEVEASMTRLVFPDKPGYVPHYAVRVLLDVLDDRALPVARRMLAEAGFSQKRLALEEIGRSGTANDIAVVRPYCDYWTADRRLHREAMSAAAALRERHRHDLNGPIQTLDAR